MDKPQTGTMMTRVISVSAAGVLPAFVIYPKKMSDLAPLVVLHGISRNASLLSELFLPEAECSGRVIIVPHFEAGPWPDFQRPGQPARPDLALLALLTQIDVGRPARPVRIDLFGHSGGAQLAHRFAMLYPNLVGRLHLAAAGWYCLPDGSMPYPYGLGPPERPQDMVWVHRHNAMLSRYLMLTVRVYVGDRDLGREDSLRKNESLDRTQGANRYARAEHYVTSFRQAAAMQSIMPDITLTTLLGITHDVASAITRAGLARLAVDAGDEMLPSPC